MASNHTPNYGLCQWEPGDKFFRKEFNENYSKIDAALTTAVSTAADASAHALRALDQLEPMSYNIYNLILQQYYSGKVTGWKKALVFDGFLDGTGIASKSAELLLRDGCLSLSSQGQEDFGLGYGGSRAGTLTTRTITMTGTGTITGYRFRIYLDWSDAQTPYVDYELTVNGDVVRSGRANWSEQCPSRTEVELTMALSSPVTVRNGDSVSLKLSRDGNWSLTKDSRNSGLGGTFLISPLSASSGTVTAKAVSLPAASRAVAWVRYKGGSVALSLTDGKGQVHTLTPGKSRSVTEPMGKSCTEQEYSLKADIPDGPITLRLMLEPRGSNIIQLYDYGICLS